MPIRPELRHHYGKAWRAVRLEVLARAGNACECRGECDSKHPLGGRCGAPNGATIVRDGEDAARWSEHVACSLCLGGDPECRPVRVVLTVAHLDHTPGNNELSNLRALCQLCHLRYDRHEHARNAAETRRRKRGQGELWKRS